MSSSFFIPKETTCIALDQQRSVNLTPPWFCQKSKYPPRSHNVIEPLINGQRAFDAVHEAISRAKKSVEIIAWGFDPSFRLQGPGSKGERLGELLSRKAERDDVEIRILVWKDTISNFIENNIIGDGLLGSGGGTGLGSGVGGLGSGSGGRSSSNKEEFNGYGSALGNSAAVKQFDKEAKDFNRDWFRYQPPKLDFRTRNFSTSDRLKNEIGQYAQYGLKDLSRTILVCDFPSHHQKMVMVDYESPDDAVGFVMGHNLLRNYWDTDEHAYFSTMRLGFAPWHDLSSRVYGPVLFDLNENFTTAWKKETGGAAKVFARPERDLIKPDVFIAPAMRRGKPVMAQICRTQPQEGDQSIRDIYKLALANARQYVYFENQYFRYKEFALHMRAMRKQLKQGGWKRDLYVFVVTNTPDDHGRMNTYEMMKAFGKTASMPAIHRKEDPKNKDGNDTVRKLDLEGVNIHVCTLSSWGQTPAGVKYKEIYVHSKLLLVDDVFFTVGSANVNLRSMETDSELNIASPAPEIAKQWREHLWRNHTGRAAGDNMAQEFKDWGKIMKLNAEQKRRKLPLSAPLLEFFDDSASGGWTD